MSNGKREFIFSGRKDKRTTGETFTKLHTKSGKTYQLWNSFGKEEENRILEDLMMPTGTLPLESKDTRIKCLLGEGNFGKVSLAYNEDSNKLLAVKKIKQKVGQKPIDMVGCQKEIDFGKILEQANIGDHFIYATDSLLTVDKHNKQCLYEFMPKITTLGDGKNFKNLISYLPSEKREIILNHIALKVIQSTQLLNQNQIFHRDLKATNILFNNDGNVYISDFGSAICSDTTAIKNALGPSAIQTKFSKNFFEVSPQIDIKYAGPMSFFGGSNQDLENWRLGITLLQLCGVIKEPERGYIESFEALDILKFPRKRSLDGKYSPEEIDQINDYYRKCVDKIKTQSGNKIPPQLRGIIFQLLKVNANERYIPNEEVEKLKNWVSDKQASVESIFKEDLTNFQIAQMTIQTIMKSLKKQIWTDYNENIYNYINLRKTILNQQVSELKNLVNDPTKNIQDIEEYIQSKITNKKFLPLITTDQLQYTLDTKRQKLQTQQIRNQQNREYESSSQTPSDYQQFASQFHQGHYNSIPAENTQHPIPNEPVNYHSIPGENTPQHSKPRTNTDYRAISGNGTPVSSDADTLKRLENQVYEAVNQLLDFYKNKMKGAKKGFSHLQKFSQRMLNKLFLYARKEAKLPEDESPYRPMQTRDIDFYAVKALFSRTESIVNQLSLNKIMELSQTERNELQKRLLQDKESLNNFANIEGIQDELQLQHVNPQNLVAQIDEKLKQLADYSAMKDTLNNQLGVSNKSELSSFKSQKSKKYTVKNRNNEILTRYTEFDHSVTYQLGSTPLYQQFVANNALKRVTSQNVYIYGPKEIAQNIAQKMYQMDKHKPKIHIYVNNELVKEKAVTHSFGTFFNKNENDITRQLSELIEIEDVNQNSLTQGI